MSTDYSRSRDRPWASRESQMHVVECVSRSWRPETKCPSVSRESNVSRDRARCLEKVKGVLRSRRPEILSSVLRESKASRDLVYMVS